MRPDRDQRPAQRSERSDAAGKAEVNSKLASIEERVRQKIMGVREDGKKELEEELERVRGESRDVKNEIQQHRKETRAFTEDRVNEVEAQLRAKLQALDRKCADAEARLEDVNRVKRECDELVESSKGQVLQRVREDRGELEEELRRTKERTDK